MSRTEAINKRVEEINEALVDADTSGLLFEKLIIELQILALITLAISVKEKLHSISVHDADELLETMIECPF